MEYEWDMNMEYDRDTDGIYIYIIRRDIAGMEYE